MDGVARYCLLDPARPRIEETLAPSAPATSSGDANGGYVCVATGRAQHTKAKVLKTDAQRPPSVPSSTFQGAPRSGFRPKPLPAPRRSALSNTRRPSVPPSARFVQAFGVRHQCRARGRVSLVMPAMLRSAPFGIGSGGHVAVLVAIAERDAALAFERGRASRRRRSSCRRHARSARLMTSPLR